MSYFNNTGENLNSYFMPIVVKPAPAPTNIGYLKRICLVAKPKNGVAEQFLQITDQTTLSNYTDNNNGYQLLGKLSSIYLALCFELAELNELLDPVNSQFYTLLLSDDYTSEEIATVNLGTFKGVVAANIDNLDLATAFGAKLNQVASCNGTANDLSYLFALLLGEDGWNNLQAVQTPNGSPLAGTLDDYFDKKLSFIGTDKVSGLHKVCGFFCGGRPIITPYLMEQVKVELQDKWQAYLVKNSPNVSELNCAKIQSYLYEDVLTNYIQTDEYANRPLISADIKVYMENNDFAGMCDIEISKITAWWRLLTTIVEE
ncbi:MAG: hypothetical protein LBS34_00325 [Rickettsiales bacterium]|jgi:hypothetical protein|nr:hypothetical protein [Rickettsiales bacterium]